MSQAGSAPTSGAVGTEVGGAEEVDTDEVVAGAELESEVEVQSALWLGRARCIATLRSSIASVPLLDK